MKTQARDMTEGSIAKNIILFYIPLAIGGLFQQLYSFVDSVVVGRGIGAQALAAVGATSIVVWLTLGFAMGITKGFCIHISQAYGKKDYHLVNRGFFVASVLSLIVGTMISIVGSLAIRDFLILMHTPGEILEQSLDYIKVILLGFVITVLNNLFMSVLQSLGDSSTPFCALLVSSITNVGLDCVFVLILKWGVQGAAVATVISQGVSVVLCILYIFLRVKILLPEKQHFRVGSHLYWELFSQSISMGLMSSIVSAGSVVLQYGINGLGTLTIAGHTAARKLFAFTDMPLISMANAGSTFVSQNRGANQPDRVRRGMRQMYLYSVVVTIAAVFLMKFGAEWMVRLISGSTEPIVLENGARYLLWNAPFYAVLGVLLCTRYALQSLGDRKSVV